MPSKAVPRKVVDYIFYYYAKLVIATSAHEKNNYRFIIDRYKRLRNGLIRISDYDHEIQELAQQTASCAFCGHQGQVVPKEIVPARLGGPIGIHNLVYSCDVCAASKGDKGLLSWWCDDLGKNKDELPRIPAGLFLKLAYEHHTVKFSLEQPCDDVRDIWEGS